MYLYPLQGKLLSVVVVESCVCKQDGPAASPDAAKREGVLETKAHLKFAFKRWSHELAGAPEAVWVTYTFGKEDATQPPASATNPRHGSIHLDVVLVNKTRTRLPEAIWFKFKPSGADVDVSSWRLNKLGSWIDPTEVVVNGSQVRM